MNAMENTARAIQFKTARFKTGQPAGVGMARAHG